MEIVFFNTLEKTKGKIVIVKPVRSPSFMPQLRTVLAFLILKLGFVYT